jgi:hypothetical protein
MNNREPINLSGYSFDEWIRKANLHNAVLSVQQCHFLEKAWKNNEHYSKYAYVSQAASWN